MGLWDPDILDFFWIIFPQDVITGGGDQKFITILLGYPIVQLPNIVIVITKSRSENINQLAFLFLVFQTSNVGPEQLDVLC